MSSNTAKELMKRHPQQRLQSPSQGASALLHVLGLASFARSFYWLTAHPNPINDAYGWHLQHLTIIGLALSTLTFISGLLADLTSNPSLFALKNTLSVATAPLEVLISVLYWGLRAIDPALVLPEWAPTLPFIADLGFHGIPALALIVDLLFFSPPYTVAALPALGLSSVIAVSYWFWVELCYQNNGFYPYPIFDALDTVGRAGLFAGSAVVMTASTLTLKWVYGTVNGRAMDIRNKPA